MALQGSWRFEEGSGSVSADMSSQGLPMTDIPGWDAHGHTGGGLAVGPSDIGGRVAVSSDFTFYDSSTVMCWVKINALGEARTIVHGPRYGAGGAWMIEVSSTGVISASWGTTTIFGSTLEAGEWYHVAFAFNWAQGTLWSNSVLYVNGEPVATGEGFPIDPGTLYWGGLTYPLNGVIDDARWYSEQLSQGEIQELMNTPVPGVLQSSGTMRFVKGIDGEWKPARTRRIVGSVNNTLHGWQLTRHNTGINKFGINGERLPVYSGLLKPLAGTVIRDKKITTGLDLSNGNITVERCYIQPTQFSGAFVVTAYDVNTDTPAAMPVTIRDCTLDGSLLNDHDAAMSCGIRALGIVTGNYVTGFGSGIAVISLGDQLDGYISGNYVTGLRAWGDPATDGNHSDGFTVRDFSCAVVPTRQLIVENNRFDCASGNDTGACFLQTYSGPIDNVIIRGNLLEGEGYTLGLNELNYPYSNISVINNRFYSTGYGASYVQGGSGYTEWLDNYINSPGLSDNKGGIVTAGL